MADSHQTLLFLCTGNYYRSRFAEMWFNHLASASGLAWRAESRGLATETNHLLPGVISPATIAALAARGVIMPEPHREPITCRPVDFPLVDRVVALKEAEHRPLMRSRHPDWAEQIEYWDFHDVDCCPSEEMLPRLAARVEELVEELRRRAST